jgi:hypothetical protein
MPIDLPDFVKTSPFLYHLTYSTNVNRIHRLRQLDCAAKLMRAGGYEHLLRERRLEMPQFAVDGDTVLLTDQKPINEANIEFQGGWQLPDLIEALNNRVFFWRGSRSGLLAKDRGHHAKYVAMEQELTFLRLPFQETNELNAARGPELSKYNTGAARRNNGKRILRGPTTFSAPESADFDIGEVREVAFCDFLVLPMSTEYCRSTWSGPWKSLFSNEERPE